MHPQTHFGVRTQLGLHLTLINLAVRPMLLAFGHAAADHPNQPGGLGNRRAIMLIRRPIGA